MRKLNVQAAASKVAAMSPGLEMKRALDAPCVTHSHEAV